MGGEDGGGDKLDRGMKCTNLRGDGFILRERLVNLGQIMQIREQINLIKWNEGKLVSRTEGKIVETKFKGFFLVNTKIKLFFLTSISVEN